jgi:hypothetical protein
MKKPSAEYEHWLEHDIAYWRFVETEDVELAVNAQKGFRNGVLGTGRLHSVEGESSSVDGRKVRADDGMNRTRGEVVSGQSTGHVSATCRAGESGR